MKELAAFFLGGLVLMSFMSATFAPKESEDFEVSSVVTAEWSKIASAE